MTSEQSVMKQTNYPYYFSEATRFGIIFLIGLFSVIAITVLQDFLHSRVNNYSFYISESLLYKTVWFLFLPLLFLQYGILRKYKIKTVFRVISAFLLPIPIHLLLTPLTVWFVSDVFYSHTYSFQKVLRYTLAEDLYKVLIVYILSAIVYLYFSKENISDSIEFKDESPLQAETQTIVLDKIVISNGRNYLPVTTDEILYIAAATPYISIQLANKRYFHTETLKSICEKLDKKIFVRIHKSSIVNLKKVVSYKSRLNGDYDLNLENGDKIRLSRNYAENFKKVYNSTPQVKS